MAPLQNAIKTPEGVEVNGFLISPCVENCNGCERVRAFENQEFCSSYPDPASKWNGGKCNFATHIKVEASAQAKINPLKASKRAAKGRK
ncbi:MAG: PxxKW family cysteine-rich protein [Desulfovibrio sp.]|nr:PxxKW family cysteine-rich protein [Desulfovibrio sp.]